MTTFVTRDGWGARPPRSVSHAIVPKGTAIHWLGSPVNTDSHDRCAPAVRSIQNYHMDANGWVDGAYTAIVCPHDYVFAMRGAGVRTAANGTDDANGSYYAACGLLGQGQEPSQGMLDGLGWLVRQLRKSGAGQYVISHSTIKATSCPGTLTPHIGDIALRAEDKGDWFDMATKAEFEQVVGSQLEWWLAKRATGGGASIIDRLRAANNQLAGIAAAVGELDQASHDALVDAMRQALTEEELTLSDDDVDRVVGAMIEEIAS